MIEQTGTTGRRTFIKKASAGAVLSIMPAKSIWATGGGNLLQSIQASAHGSGWSQQCLNLLDPCEWQNQLSQLPTGVRLSSFSSVFGGFPIGSNGIPLLSSDQLQTLNNGKKKASEATLWHVLNTDLNCSNSVPCSQGSGGSSSGSGSSRDNSSSDSSSGGSCDGGSSSSRSGRSRWSGSFSSTVSKLHDATYLITAMYLNALYHGSYGIHFPVTIDHSPGAPRGLFNSPEVFAKHLYSLAQQNPDQVAYELNSLIQQTVCQQR